MNPFDKETLRAACHIRRGLEKARQDYRPLQLPFQAWGELQGLVTKVQRARARGWHAAAGRCLERFLRQADRLQWQLGYFLTDLRRQTSPRRLPPDSEIYRDIVALKEEFPEVTVDLQAHTLSVETEPIELEGIDLGRFEIRLDWGELRSSLPYRVVALDPNPAASNDSVTHPHVQDEVLCEGEGRAAVRGALAEGRLYDFFLLVSQILHSYGQGAAFVELNRWHGVRCHDCDGRVGSDEGYDCHRCSETVCDECYSICSQCGNSTCSNCTSECNTCGGSYCKSCLRECSACGESVCSNCLEDNLCGDCHAEQQQDDTNDSDDGTAQSTAGPDPDLEVATCG